jgi:hypothetical protein
MEGFKTKIPIHENTGELPDNSSSIYKSAKIA